jgi:hypothetical protein
VIEEVQSAAKADPEIAEAVQEVEVAAKADPKFSQAVQAVEEAMNSQASTVHNYGKLAEALPNLKAVFQGNTIHGGVTL